MIIEMESCMNIKEIVSTYLIKSDEIMTWVRWDRINSEYEALGPSGSRERHSSDMEGWLGSGESFSEGT